MVTFERGHAGSLTWSIVVGKLGQGKKFGPVISLVVAVGAEVLLEGLVDPLGLPISLGLPIFLGVISRGKVELHVKCST